MPEALVSGLGRIGLPEIAFQAFWLYFKLLIFKSIFFNRVLYFTLF